MPVQELPIVATIAGKCFSRADVLAWENRRIDAAARKIGVVAPPAGDVAVRREQFVQIKHVLGSDELLRRLQRNARITNRMAVVQAGVSARRRLSVTELSVPGGSAKQFTEWFDEITFSSDRYEMERACPDHFVLRFVDGRQQVLETNGGSPLAALFDIDYDDVSAITTPVDPRFPYRLDGVAVGANGKPIGAVRHQFRDTAGGIHARLVVEFPLLMIGTVIRGHRWHLACEFSNWLEAAIAADKG